MAEKAFKPIDCTACRNLDALGITFSMAFQPIVGTQSRGIFGYEALVRGPQGESARSVLSQLNDSNRYRFDQSIRVKAIDMAKQLGLQGMLSINFFPNAVYNAETCIRATLEAARQKAFPTDRIMFEVTEGEKVTDLDHLKRIFHVYKKNRFTTAIDDFGAGYAGLNLLAEWQPDIIKLDMALVRNIHTDKIRRSIVSAILGTCAELDIRVIAEGIEHRDEYRCLADKGVALFQGYYFSKPGFESLPDVPDVLWD